MDRRRRYELAATSLALLSDEELAAAVAAAPVLGVGIGGTSRRIERERVPVFVKEVPLTALELRAEHRMSTADLHRQPPFCQYGVGIAVDVGSPGFGAWRELAAHAMTTHRELGGRSGSFPLLYHWRVVTGLPASRPSLTPEAVDRHVDFWHGAESIRERLQALAASPASLLLFLEFVPWRLDRWLADRRAAGEAAFAAACATVDVQLWEIMAGLRELQLVHFDSHLQNFVTDGERVYLTDFGLATSPRFRLHPAEREFVERHHDHDAGYAVTQLVNWLVTEFDRPADPAARNALVDGYARGAEPASMPAAAAGLVRRYAPVAAVMNPFYWRLHLVERTGPYPAAQLEQALASAGAQKEPRPVASGRRATGRGRGE